MKSVLCGLIIVLGIGLALAQGLTRKEQAALSNVIRDLDRIERNLGVIMDASDAETRQKRLSGEGPKIEKLLRGTKADLDALPAGHPDVAAQITRHGALSTRFLEVSKTVSEGSQAANANQTGWEAYAKSPEFKADQEFIKSVNETLKGAASWFIKIDDLNLMGNPNSMQTRERILGLAKDTARFDQKLNEMLEKYTSYGKAAQRDLNSVNATREEFTEVMTAQSKFKESAAAAQAKFAAGFEKALNASVAAKNWNALSDLWGDVGKSRTAVIYLAAVYKALELSNAASMEAVAVKVEETYKNTMQRLANDVINNNKPPVDIYKGADLLAVRTTAQNQWKKAFPKYEILAVRIIDTEWARETGLKWDDFDKAWVQYDSSSLDVAIAVKWDAKHAAVFRAELIKLHLKGNTIIMRDFFNPKPSPAELVLLSKFK